MLPAIVCAPVVTKPLAVAEASGILKVCVLVEEAILKSVPEVPVANVCVVAVRVFNDAIPVPEGTAKVPSARKKLAVPPPLAGVKPFAVEENTSNRVVACVPVMSVALAVAPVLFALNVLAAIVASFALVTTLLLMVVALPTLVTSPVIFAFVVTVAALPVVFWLSVGKSAAVAVVSAPVPVVDFTMPVELVAVPGA